MSGEGSRPIKKSGPDEMDVSVVTNGSNDVGGVVLMRPNLSWALAVSQSRLPRATRDAFVRGTGLSRRAGDSVSPGGVWLYDAVACVYSRG
ncbi:unnamed protein product [Arctogadus glacialis]